MSHFLQYFIWLPLLGFIVSLCIPKLKESLLAIWAIGVSFVFFVSAICFASYWMVQGSLPLNQKHLTVFQTDDIEIFIDFYFDTSTAVFSVVGSFIMLLVSMFSRYYLHRDEGFKRFFSTAMLFFLSYSILVFSGNFETLFLGWEVVGLCSFLLIGFYRDRYLPVKNSMKVISLYRLGDICIILAMWMSHHLWHENITFEKLNFPEDVILHVSEHRGYAYFVASMIVIAAAIKSAQWPFSSWLPRAMEGPTSSSALFYGGLSVHMGVYLLIRTYPYWENMSSIHYVIIFMGLITAFVANLIARVQSSVKAQIAYASAAQIGIIFIEIALGWHWLALVHTSGNMLLRTYQLLVSPSVLSYELHNMVFSFQPKPRKKLSSIMTRMNSTFYLWSIKEWKMDDFLTSVLWNPFKRIGFSVRFLTSKWMLVSYFIILVFGTYIYYHQSMIPPHVFEWLPDSFSLLTLILILSAFSDKGDARHAWLVIVFSHLFMTLSIALLNENFGHNHMMIYLSGTLISAVTGYVCLHRMYALDRDIQLNQFHGYVYEHPKTAIVFLIACLGFLGLPFTPSFIGIDLLFSHIHKHEEIIIVLTALSFLVVEIAILRIYTRVFLGQYKKANHAMAYRSS